MDLAAAEQVSDVIEHLFWGGRAYLAQSLMCAGGPKTASISTGPWFGGAAKRQSPAGLTGKE
jgi:hypothetical protein